MDELIAETGLGKATVYRLFAAKDVLVGAYLERLSAQILGLIDGDITRHGDARTALLAILGSIDHDLHRPGFRGCPFNNASIEYDDPSHPARIQARQYRQALRERLTALCSRLDPAAGGVLGEQLAVLIDGAYTSAAHLGPAGPATAGMDLARKLVMSAGAEHT